MSVSSWVPLFLWMPPTYSVICCFVPAVCLRCRRDRLAVITQLLVPLLLVLLAMAVSSLQTSTPQQPPLPFTRRHCLMGSPALLAAAPSVRQQVEFRGFMDGYPR
jgi:hypothetical protein